MCGGAATNRPECRNALDSMRREATALTREGATEIGRSQIRCNRDAETIKPAEAHTLKADGNRIPVVPVGITMQVGVELPGAPGITMPGIETRKLTRNLGDQSINTRRSAMVCPPIRISEDTRSPATGSPAGGS